MRRLRALLTAVAVALGVAAVLGVQITLAALDRQASDAQAARAGRSDLDVRVVAGRGLTPADVASLANLDGVAEAQPLETKRVAARVRADQVDAVTVTVVGLDEHGEAALRPVSLLSGRLPDATSSIDVALDQGVSEALAPLNGGHPLGVGDDLRLTTATGPDRFHVVGITAGTSGGAAFTRSAVFVGDSVARGPFALGLRTPLVALRLLPGRSSDAVAAAARDSLGPVVTTTDPRAGSVTPLSQLRPLLLLIVVLSVFIGAGVTANSVAVGALERRREIGLLRAAGASRTQVLRLLLGEALLVAAAGAAAGVGAGIGLGALLVDHFAAADLPIPATQLDPLRIAGAVLAGMGAALVGALLPALAAQRLTALEALRRAPLAGREHTSRRLLALAPLAGAVAAIALLVDRPASVAVGAGALMVAVVILLPLLAPLVARALGLLARPLAGGARVAAANLARRRNRTALTVAGLAVSVATATALSVLTSGALDAGDHWVGSLFVGDTVVVSPATAPDAVAADIAATPGVEGVSRLRFLSAPVEGSLLGFAVIDTTPYATRGGLELVEGDRAEALSALDGTPSVLVPAQLADSLGWHRGRVIEVTTAGGAERLTIAGVVAHSFPSGDGREALLISRPVALQSFGDDAAGFDDLQVLGSAPEVQQRVAAAATSYGMQATPVAAIRESAQRSLAHSIELLMALSWLAVIIAMLAVVNTLMVNVRQGTRELALLRAVGLSRGNALRLLLTEAGLLAATGAAIGIALGCAVALPLLHASSSPGFAPSFAFPVTATLVAAVTVLGGAILAALPPARAAARASIVAAIRHD